MKQPTYYKAAVIGCGNIGTGVGRYDKKIQPASHAQAFLKHKKTRLVAMVENDTKKINRLKASFPQVKFYSDIDKMMAAVRPDIVAVATPTQFHHRHVCQIAKYGCPAIICEKPIAYTIKEAKEMVAICKKNNSILFINHQRHFDSLLNNWSRKVKNNLLGKIHQGNLFYYNGLFNSGSHAIDLIRQFVGDPISVVAKSNLSTSNFPSDSNIDALLFFKNKAVVSVQSLSKNYGFFGLRLFGEQGLIDIKNLGFEIEYRKKIHSRHFLGYFALSDDIISEGAPRSLMIATLNHVVNVLLKKEKPVSTGEDGLKILKILLAMKKSAANGSKKINIK